MDIPLQVSFHGVQHSDAIDKLIREKARALERYYDRVTSCRVVLEVDGRHRHHGRRYIARIDLGVPGDAISITDQAGEDPHATLRDAFDAARRKLEDYARVQRGDVKRHAS